MDKNDDYAIECIDNEADARVCAQLISEEFVSNNRLSTYSQVTVQQLFEIRMYPSIMETLDEKLSFLVRHRPTNEIVSGIIARDLSIFYEKHPYDPSSPATKFPLLDLISEMRDYFVHHEFDQELKPNLVLFIPVGATRAAHTGKGIAARLRAHVCEYARKSKGFKYAFVQTIHPATRHIYVDKMNGKEMSVVDPATWQWKKKDDGLSYPIKDYKGKPIVNILVKL